jgi:serine/threonine-protein kinase
MAPEQARGEAVNERADVFGLGAILCEIITGSPPYECTEGRRAHRRATKGLSERMVRRIEECAAPKEVITLALRCLSASPASRPANAGEVSRAMGDYMESDLRRAERDLERFFELSVDLFCIAGLDGYFRRINPNFSRLLGHEDSELLGRPFLDFVHPEDRQATCEAMEQLRQGQPIARFQNRYRDASGLYRTFEWTSKSVPEEGVIFAVARDMTGRA